MKASPSDQRSILDIARFDQQATSLRHKAVNLPELAELASTTTKSNNARDLRIAAETELSDVKRELLRAEGDVEQIVMRIRRDEARLIGGSASPKELEQLQHEVGTLGTRRAELEEVELEIMMRVDAINERITSLKSEEAELAAVIADLEIRKERLRKRGMFISEIERRIAAQASREEREAQADHIITNDGDEDALLRSVENLWEDLPGQAK